MSLARWTCYSSEMGNNFRRTTLKTPPSQNPLWGYSATRSPTSKFRKSMIWFFYPQIKANRTIVCYRKYYCLCSLNCSWRLLSPLVLSHLLKLVFLKRQKRNIKALRRFKLAIWLIWKHMALFRKGRHRDGFFAIAKCHKIIVSLFTHAV